MFISGECSWRREPVGGGHIQAGRVRDHGLAHHLGRPAGAGPWTPPQRRPVQRRRLSTCSAAAPSELERQEAPTILVACLINSHSQSEGLRIVRAPYACVLVGSRFVDSGLVVWKEL